MNKFGGIIAALLLMLPSAGEAQTLYNSRSDSTSQSIYNGGSGYNSGGGPLSLKQMLQGNPNAASGRVSSSYYGNKNYRPYGADRNDYSLARSPREIRESRAKRDREAQQRELDNLAALERAKIVPAEEQAQESLRLLNNRTTAPIRRRVNSKYKQRDQRDDVFEKPKKVFNSIY